MNPPTRAEPGPLDNLTRQKGVLGAFLYEYSGQCLIVEESERFPGAVCRGLAMVISRVSRDFHEKENHLGCLHLEFHEIAVLSMSSREHIITILAEPDANLRFLSNSLALVVAHLATNQDHFEKMLQSAARATKNRSRKSSSKAKTDQVPPEFFVQLRNILAEHAGPTAGRNLLHRAMREMELNEASMPRNKVPDLLGAISVRIAYRARRRVFLSESAQMARAYGINPSGKKTTASTEGEVSV